MGLGEVRWGGVGVGLRWDWGRVGCGGGGGLVCKCVGMRLLFPLL